MLRSAGWVVEGAVRWLVVGMLVGLVLPGWRLWVQGLAGVLHPVLRFVLLVDLVQEDHFEAGGEPSRRGLALQLRLQMELDVAGRWVQGHP